VKVPRLIAISDTHGVCDEVDIPDGDILVHAGDLSISGSQSQILSELNWIARQPHIQKIVIPGNHDRYVEGNELWFRSECADRGIVGLIDEGFSTHGLVFYGSPWTPPFGSGWAYNAPDDLRMIKWNQIPFDVDVVITHGPPLGTGDLNYFGESCGCPILRDILNYRTYSSHSGDDKYHIGGHIHEGYGLRHHPMLPITFVNASLVNLRYEPKNSPIILDV
jgi:hypothetical protein